ncbi:MAG: hypothetical protein ACXVAG_19045 [Vulcanimicrobiaceae bacterium]
MELKNGADSTEYISRVPYRVPDPFDPLPGLSDQTLLDYWRWAHSDILENVERGIFAEFLVAAALGITRSRRIAWAGYDLDYNGFKLEVKSTAYLQAWNQRALSKPLFSIGARKQLSEDGLAYEPDPRYVANCYVFCVFTDTDGPTSNVLDVTRWEFYIVDISQLIGSCGVAKTLSLRRLKTMTKPLRYPDLKSAVDHMVSAGINLSSTPLTPSEKGSRQSQSCAKSGPLKKRRTYMVAQRKTRLHPVVVEASNYEEAHLLGRADPRIASFGTQVSVFALTETQLKKTLADGAIDLRPIQASSGQ